MGRNILNDIATWKVVKQISQPSFCCEKIVKVYNKPNVQVAR